MRTLRYCPKCKDRSVATKVYKSSTEPLSLVLRRVLICINKGCGFHQDLPPINESNGGENERNLRGYIHSGNR